MGVDAVVGSPGLTESKLVSLSDNESKAENEFDVSRDAVANHELLNSSKRN